MQGATSDSASAMKEIDEVIAQLNEIATAIAEAVEQQDSATNEIASSAAAASTSADTASQRVADVRAKAEIAGDGTKAVLESAQDMTQQAAELGRQVDGFLAELRS